MSRSVQPVKGQCSLPLALEGREVDGAIIDQASPRGGLTGRSGASGLVGPLHKHLWAYSGSTGPSQRLGCERPNVLSCTICGESCEVRCRATRDDKCASCAQRHCWDVARKIRSGVTVERIQAAMIVVLVGTRSERRNGFKSNRPSGFFFTTLTAPGERGGIHWDRTKCGHAVGECTNKGHNRRPGQVLCKADRMDAARWNGQAPRRWNDWVTDMRRVLDVDVQYCGSWESQVRGLLHRHVLVYCPGISAARYQQVGKRIAKRLGFGQQFDVEEVTGNGTEKLARVAAYIASYVTKCGDELATCASPRTSEIVQGSYRRWSASGKWGVSMAQIRQERVQWAQERYGSALGASGGPSAPAVAAAAPRRRSRP